MSVLDSTDWNNIRFRDLGLQQYEPIYQEMLDFTAQRDSQTQDEIWLLEHHPVYTLGKNAKRHHILTAHDIPIVQVDRGGQVTYHGPGQLIAYLMLDIRRRAYGVRQVITLMETTLIELLATYGIKAVAQPKAPGVYVDGKKIAALGLRIRKGCSYHGLSLNIKMDKSPFDGINPCGYEGLEITQMADLCDEINMSEIKQTLMQCLSKKLSRQ